MNNWLVIGITFILLMFASMILLDVGLSNLCLNWFGSVCQNDKNDFLVLLGLLFPFVSFPVGAIFLTKKTLNRSKIQSAALGLFAVFPFLFIVVLIGGGSAFSKMKKEAKCRPQRTALENELKEKPLTVKITEASLASETKEQKGYKLAVEFSGLPKSFDNYTFDIVRFDDLPNESKTVYPYSISNYYEFVTIKRVGETLAFDPERFKISERSFFIVKVLWKKTGDVRLPRKAKVLVRDQSSGCYLEVFQEWIDLPIVNETEPALSNSSK